MAVEPAVGSIAAPDPSSPRVDTLERLVALRDGGAISDEEYQSEKAHVISNGT
jgi:hypothetical protein